MYECTYCNYKTNRKNCYKSHLQSNKHYNKIHNQFSYNCDLCNKTYKIKASLDRHKKIIHNQDTIEIQKQPQQNQYSCKCGKTYKHHSSFFRHKKECKQKTNENTILLNEQVQQLNNSFDLNKLINVFQTLVDKVTSTNTSTITNNNNKTINIITFLNDDCKKAPNLVDFLKDLEITRNDLYYVQEHGFVKSFEKIIMTRLENMSINKRPIHCTDPKRKAFIYKNEDMWVREIIKAYPYIKYWLSKLLGMELENWKRENPEWLDNDDKCDFVNKANIALSYPYINETRDDQVYKSLLIHLAKLKLDKHCINNFFEEEVNDNNNQNQQFIVQNTNIKL